MIHFATINKKLCNKQSRGWKEYNYDAQKYNISEQGLGWKYIYRALNLQLN